MSYVMMRFTISQADYMALRAAQLITDKTTDVLQTITVKILQLMEISKSTNQRGRCIALFVNL